MGLNDSQGLGKHQNNIDFERKKVKKILCLVKVTNLHFFFLGLFSNLLLKIEAYYSPSMRRSGMPPLTYGSSFIRQLKFIKFPSWPLVAHREK